MGKVKSPLDNLEVKREDDAGSKLEKGISAHGQRWYIGGQRDRATFS